MRLIDADKLLPQFCRDCTMFDKCCVLKDERDCYVKQVLKRIPTVNPVVIRKSRTTDLNETIGE